MGGGKRQEIALLQEQVAAQISTNNDNNETDYDLGKLDAATQIKLAEIDKEIRLEEAKIAADAAKYQADIDLKIATLEYEIKEMEAKNDAGRVKNEEINALANKTSAEADVISAEAKLARSGSSQGYYYGYGSENYNWYG